MITLIQTDIQWIQPLANMQAAESAILAAPRSDLYVLPEMWSTGFLTEPQTAPSLFDDNEALHWMLRMSDSVDAAIAGSMAVREGDGYYNRFYFVKPGGEAVWYDKHHLFTYGGENLHYTPGEERVVVEWRGVRYLLQVCYDLRFPVFSRNGYTEDRGAQYDCILYVASWPTSRRQVWDVLLKARAIENQCYVCGVNRIGEDPVCRYDGGTQFIDPYGRVMASCQNGEAQGISAEIDMERLLSFRKKFPVLRDGD